MSIDEHLQNQQYERLLGPGEALYNILIEHKNQDYSCISPEVIDWDKKRKEREKQREEDAKRPRLEIYDYDEEPEEKPEDEYNGVRIIDLR